LPKDVGSSDRLGITCHRHYGATTNNPTFPNFEGPPDREVGKCGLGRKKLHADAG